MKNLSFLVIVATVLIYCDSTDFENEIIPELLVEKNVFKSGENIKANLINNTGSEIYVLNSVPCTGTLQKITNNKWKLIDDFCPSITNWSYRKIETNEVLSLTIPSSAFEDLSNEAAGLYRYVIDVSSRNWQDEKTITSKSFEIIN